MLYTVGEMAKKLNIAPSTLRYYDKEGLLPFVERSDGGMRMFKDDDLELLLIIDCLKKTGMSIKEIKTFMDLVQQGDDSINQRLEMFQKQCKAVELQLAQLQDTLDILKYKRWYYETAKAMGATAVPRAMKTEDVPEDIRPYKEKYEKRRNPSK
ncbi:MerR family transcriptional regulator [Anaerocolumna xylanovorans]|uniref:DNA-binding transcriptional regulator, MerR family n=1 Tax=Anaerocolumna xylanovorans DSM 12503 TaxID=1121345 RepID=A0A1M7Y0U8_9FIRM|nr:MerR family transcriptional regulator [Anaerocolumna xylanovorans]SHO45328.1 DNA-binding transcriptional regulator, MerR family [Anaerocolumna xylanovorans DSM 12503]